MAKPRELYSGPAPERTFAQMGAGIAEAYANVGRIHGQGMAAMGESIGKGIQAGVSAYAGYAQQQKKIESQNKAYDNLFKNPLVQDMFFQDKQGPEGVITAKDQASQFLAQTADMKPSEKNMFYNTIVPPAIGQYYKMQQIEADQAGAMSRLMAGPFAAEAARLAGTPSAPMIVPSTTGEGIISPTPAVPMSPAPAPMQPVSPATQAPNSWLNYRPKKRG